MTISNWLRGGVLLAAALSLSPANAAVIADGDCPREPTRIVVLGDSLADGLWGSLFRTYARCDTVETLRLTAVSDGLAKTGHSGWLQRYALAVTELETRESDIVVVQIGANDITTIRTGNKRESFGQSDWDKLYGARVAGLTRGLKQRVAQVFWFGLPIVGKSNLETPYQTISGIQQAAVRASGGVFIDIHKLTMFGTGAYSQNGTFAGRLQQLRASDKVHFTKSGYDLVAEQVLDDLASFTAERDRRAALKDVELQ